MIVQGWGIFFKPYEWHELLLKILKWWNGFFLKYRHISSCDFLGYFFFKISPLLHVPSTDCKYNTYKINQSFEFLLPYEVLKLKRWENILNISISGSKCMENGMSYVYLFLHQFLKKQILHERVLIGIPPIKCQKGSWDAWKMKHKCYTF